MELKNDFKARLLVLTIVFGLVCVFSACNRPTSQAEVIGANGVGLSVGVTILYPSDGAQFQVGDFVDVYSQIADPAGVLAAILTANGQTLRRDQLVSPVASGELYQPWVPKSPGTYILQVILDTGSGGQQISDQVTVYVGEGPTDTATEKLVSETLTITATLEYTYTPTLSVTPEAPTDTPTPDSALATGLQNSNCRFGPSAVYGVSGYLMQGETVPIVGRNTDSSWWVVELTNPAKQCWVWGDGVTVTGNLTGLTIVPAPPTPTPTPTNTPKPPTDTPKPSGPIYNACHDYQDIGTCNSDPNGFGNCTWDTGLNKCQP